MTNSHDQLENEKNQHGELFLLKWFNFSEKRLMWPPLYWPSLHHRGRGGVWYRVFICRLVSLGWDGSGRALCPGGWCSLRNGLQRQHLGLLLWLHHLQEPVHAAHYHCHVSWFKICDLLHDALQFRWCLFLSKLNVIMNQILNIIYPCSKLIA